MYNWKYIRKEKVSSSKGDLIFIVRKPNGDFEIFLPAYFLFLGSVMTTGLSLSF